MCSKCEHSSQGTILKDHAADNAARITDVARKCVCYNTKEGRSVERDRLKRFSGMKKIAFDADKN